MYTYRMNSSPSASFTFREKHLLLLFSEYEDQKLPLDYFVSQYFRKVKALGSKDRAVIAETIYALIRWKGLYDYLLEGDPTWQDRLELYRAHKPESFLKDEGIPLHVRVSFPQDLFQQIVNSWGEEDAAKIALACNAPAPTAVRVNTQKISREELLKKFQEQNFSVSLSQESPVGIIFHKKINFFCLPEFQNGFFEIQDEASQQVALLAKAKPGDRVLDFCAGAGGKTLAFAESLKGTGQIYLHDIRLHALHEARKRLRRAGIQNSQIIHESEKEKLKKLKKQMDVVFVDAPCSGTGTLRRNPDMKWKFSEEMVLRLVSQQRVIFEQALSYMKPEGKIIFATCSILKNENQNQVEHFLKTYDLELEGDVFQSIPRFGGKDGFFAATFRRRSTPAAAPK